MKLCKEHIFLTLLIYNIYQKLGTNEIDVDLIEEELERLYYRTNDSELREELYKIWKYLEDYLCELEQMRIITYNVEVDTSNDVIIRKVILNEKLRKKLPKLKFLSGITY